MKFGAVRKLALALPEVTEAPHHQVEAWVRKAPKALQEALLTNGGEGDGVVA